MLDYFTGLFGAENAQMAMYITMLLGVVLLLLILWLIIRMIKRPRFAGGRRSKQARLAVTDAAAVDPRRRLVLIRRDDVEHLIMIGGPTDIVIENDIRRNEPARPISTAPAATTPAAAPIAPAPAPAAVPVARPAPATQPVPKPAPKPEPVAATPPPAPAPAPEPKLADTPLVAATGIGAIAGSAAGTVAAKADDVKDTASATLDDLIADSKAAATAVTPKASSIEDDMNALLGEIAPPKK